jgi:predicted acyltransferase (DUF342 family)
MKYKLTNERIKHCGRTLYRIKALKDFSNVKKGDLGGYVESASSLSQEGDCWVYDNTCIYGNNRVYGNVGVFDNARVFGDAKIYKNPKVSLFVKIKNLILDTYYFFYDLGSSIFKYDR